MLLTSSDSILKYRSKALLVLSIVALFYILMKQQGLRKANAYQLTYRDFSQVLDAQEIGAGRVKK
jgi:hypothetical protein